MDEVTPYSSGYCAAMALALPMPKAQAKAAIVFIERMGAPFGKALRLADRVPPHAGRAFRPQVVGLPGRNRGTGRHALQALSGHPNHAKAIRSTRVKLLVLGASGPTGRHLVSLALDQGHEVTAFVRRPEAFDLRHQHLRITAGDTTRDAENIEQAVRGQDAVLSALGVSRSFLPNALMAKSVHNIVA